jgi:single-strand DNA-binding protein
MASSLNRVNLIGHIGKDPELRYNPAGKAITSLSLATTEKWKDKQTGENQERTEWHRLVCFERLAEVCRDYLKKGSKIWIEGKLKTTKYTDKNGVERYSTAILVSELIMLDGKNNQTNQTQGTSSHEDYSSGEGYNQHPQFDDDIPF